MVAVQLQEGLHSSAGRLPQQRERHEQPSRPPLLPAGRLVLLQGLVQLVLEPVHRVRAVDRVSVWRRTPRPNVRACSSVKLLFRITTIFHFVCLLTSDSNVYTSALFCNHLESVRTAKVTIQAPVSFNMKISFLVKLSQF